MAEIIKGDFRASRGSRFLVYRDGVPHEGVPPDATPEQQEKLNALFDRMQAEAAEVGEHPERFVRFQEGQSAEFHRRGDATCSDGRCRGKDGPPPACPYGCGGLVHQSHYAESPAQCDGCDQAVLLPAE